MNIREIEKNKKMGFIFYIRYDGVKFQSFDTISGKKSVKGEFERILKEIGFSWAKGVQQAGRTDAKVSANENILYLTSYFYGDLEEIKNRFNEKSGAELKITLIKKTFPNLSFPDFVEKREYIYSYPKNRIKHTTKEIEDLCEKYSGTYDVSIFTDKKGLELKEHIRTVEIKYIDGKLVFLGNSFMPKQVRITSSFILTGEKKAIEGKYLTLNKIYLKDEIKNVIFTENKDFSIQNVESIESNGEKNIHIFYVKNKNKGIVIGKNGKNIKELKRLYGEIIVKEINDK